MFGGDQRVLGEGLGLGLLGDVSMHAEMIQNKLLLARERERSIVATFDFFDLKISSGREIIQSFGKIESL